MDAIPLSPEDRAILELESDTVAGHTCKVVVLGEGAPGLDALRAQIADRLGLTPALRRRLGGGAREPAWVPAEGFEIGDHVVAGNRGVALDRGELPAQVAGLFAQRLPRDRPLWRIDVLPLNGGGAALVWRIHHAVADGTTTMRYARLLLWGDPAASSAEAAPAPASHAADDARRRGHLAAFVRREFARSRSGSPFDGRIGTRREIGFATAPLAALHDASKALADATLNDAVLAVLAGALRRWLESEHGSLAEVRAKVPVSLHHEGDDAGNRDSFFTLPLPLNEPDPVARLRAVRAATATRKGEHDAQEIDTLHRELAHVSPRLEAFCERIERSPRRFALNVSNVPGPRVPVAVLGAPVAELHSIAEIGQRHALRVAVVSCAGTLGFGFCADPGIVAGLESLVSGTAAEAAALVGARS